MNRSSSLSEDSRIKKGQTTIVSDPDLNNLDLPRNMIHAMINEAFYMFDADHSGDIDKKEFKNLIRSINPDISTDKIIALMKGVDTDGSGKIDKEEFTEMMMEQFQKLQKEEVPKKGEENKIKKSPVTTNLELVFNLYDKDIDGKISARDFQESSKDLGDENPLDEEEGKILIDIAKIFWKKRPNYDDTIKDDPDFISEPQFLNLLMNLEFVAEANLLAAREKGEKEREAKERKEKEDKERFEREREERERQEKYITITEKSSTTTNNNINNNVTNMNNILTLKNVDRDVNAMD